MKKDLRSENVKKIAEDFPMCITEIKDKNGNLKKVIDFEKLKELLTGELRDREEAYEFTWAGKREALHRAFEYNDKILRPVVEDSLNFFDTQNIYIEGDNLDVLKILRRSYFEKIKMIYIDPPYNTGHDFIYKDDSAMSQDEYEYEIGLRDEEDNMLFENKESNGKFHSDWCSMIYSRLLLARDLLRPDGVIFISIDDNEVASLRKICDEVFGEDNFVGMIIRKTKTMTADNENGFNIQHEYILSYGKVKSKVFLFGKDKTFSNYSNPDNDPNGDWCSADPSARSGGKSTFFPIKNPYTNKVDYPPIGRYWAFSQETLQKYISRGKIKFKEEHKNDERGFIFKRYKNDLINKKEPVHSLFADDNNYMNQNSTIEIKKIFDSNIFDYPKPVSLMSQLAKISIPLSDNKSSELTSSPPPIGQKSPKQAQEGLYNENNGIGGGESSTRDGDIILDFFSGSATTAHAVMQLNAEDNGNRKYIMVQIPEKCDEKSEAYKAGYKNICEIGKERIRRAGKKIKEETNASIDYGFKVFKVDSSNFKEEISVPADEFDFKNLEKCIENIKEDRTSLDLVYQCILSLGKELTLPIKIENIDGFTVYNVDNFSIMCCFDENISDEVMKYMADKEPEAVYFRDSCFRDSSHKLNVKEYFKVMSENTRFEDV